MLTPKLVLQAYSQGIFPMGDALGGISWHSPDPRCVIDLNEFHIPKRLLRTYKKKVFNLKINQNWDLVIKECSKHETTWINNQIITVYTELYHLGFAHSVEAYIEEELVGGLYGVSICGAFMGESMFHKVTDASKVCLVFLVEHLQKNGYVLLDCQYMTEHLSKFGAKLISRQEYLERLSCALKLRCQFSS